MKRQSRQRRNRGVRVKLTARDALLLEAMNRFRLARTRDLLAVAFAGVHPMTASLRLRRLFDAGYLDVRCGDRSQENIYVLGPLGRRFIEAQGLPVGCVPRGGTAHHLAIVRAWSDVAEAVERTPGLSLKLTRADWELRQEFGEASLPLVPDLFMVLSVTVAGGGEKAVAMAVEVDLGTESLGVLARKIAAYDELRDRKSRLFGYHNFGLAMVLGNRGRSAAVRHLLEHHWSGWWRLWTAEVGPSAALAEVANGTLCVEPAPFTDSRYGNGGSAGVSPAIPRENPLSKGEH